MANKKKSPMVEIEKDNIETCSNNIELESVTKSQMKKNVKIKYVVECISENRVWLRKDMNTVIILTGNFNYKVGDTVEL